MAIEGSITVEVLVEEEALKIPVAIRLQDAQHEFWHTNEQGLFLTPGATIPAHYVFTFELDAVVDGVHAYGRPHLSVYRSEYRASEVFHSVLITE